MHKIHIFASQNEKTVEISVSVGIGSYVLELCGGLQVPGFRGACHTGGSKRCFSPGKYFSIRFPAVPSTAFPQMQGSLSVTQNDVSMMGRAVLIGLTMYFPLAFRLKFFFTNRTSLLIAALGQCFCNLVFPPSLSNNGKSSE